MEEIKNWHENIGRIDELTMGTPSKGGSITVKVDWSKPEEAEELINNALEQRRKAYKRFLEELK